MTTTLGEVRRERGTVLAEVPKATARAWDVFVRLYGAGSRAALAEAVGMQLAVHEGEALPEWLEVAVRDARFIHAANASRADPTD